MSAAAREVAARRGWLKLITRVDDDGQPRPLALFDLLTDPAEDDDLLSRRAPDEGLLDAVRRYLQADARRAQQAPETVETSIDAERLQWLREMGDPR